MKISIVIPIRKGSQRVKHKNTRAFTQEGKSLTEIKTEQLLKIQGVDEIVFTTDDDVAIKQIKKIAAGDNRVKIDVRPDELCSSTTIVKDLIDYMTTITKGDVIMWLHVTSPLVNEKDYEKALEKYFNSIDEGYDSLMSVAEIQQFLWSKKTNKIINTDDTVNKWPNTQDLEPLYEVTHAFYVNSRDNYLKMHDRIGIKPYLYITKNEKNVDVDHESDFEFAQKLYQLV